MEELTRVIKIFLIWFIEMTIGALTATLTPFAAIGGLGGQILMLIAVVAIVIVLIFRSLHVIKQIAAKNHENE